MSISHKGTGTCFACHATFPITMWQSINTNLAEDLPQKVITGEFFDVKCPSCGQLDHLEYDILYHDMKQNAYIYLLHNDNEKYSEKLKETGDAKKLLDKQKDEYILRIVNDSNQLREKVAALEAGRDDRIIELMKCSLTEELKRVFPDFIATHYFYTYQSGKELMFFYDADENNRHCLISDELYNEHKEEYLKSLEQIPDFFLPIYDTSWAKGFLMQIESGLFE